MREEHRHGGRSEIGMDIPRECSVLCREQFWKEGLGGQECDRQGGRHGVRGLQYALPLSVEQYEPSLTAQ